MWRGLFLWRCVGTLASSHSPQTWISRVRCKGLPVSVSDCCCPGCNPPLCGSRDSESSIRASVFSFQTLGSSLNPKQLEFHFATVGYQSVIVKYMIYWVWEIISPSRWFLLIEILLSVSNLSIRAGSSLGGRSREGQFPVFETSNDSNNNFISKTTFIFRTITKNVPTLFVKIVKNRLCINFD